jgi:glycerol uptake facilitator protein
MVGLSFGLVVAIVVYGLGNVSGAHINPAVTVTLAATRRFPWREVAPYVLAQLVGAVLGAFLVVGVFGTGSVDVSSAGAVAFGDGVGYGRALLAEAVGTFLLLFTVMALAVDRRAPAGWAGFVIGLSVTCLVLVVAPVTGASVNPARAFGPLVAASLTGGATEWSQFPAYVVGPLLGGLAAALVYDAVARPREVPDAEEPSQGTQGDIEGSQPTGDGAGAGQPVVPPARQGSGTSAPTGAADG